MGRRGPSPHPTALRLLHGEEQRRIPKNEPQPERSSPVPPSWFDDDRLAVWERLVYHLRVMHMLSAADQDSMVVYVEAFITFEAAAKLVKDSSVIIRGRDGGAVKNPALQPMRDYAQLLRQMAGEFGLTPAARVALSTKEAAGAASGAESLLS